MRSPTELGQTPTPRHTPETGFLVSWEDAGHSKLRRVPRRLAALLTHRWKLFDATTFSFGAFVRPCRIPTPLGLFVDLSIIGHARNAVPTHVAPHASKIFLSAPVKSLIICPPPSCVCRRNEGEIFLSGLTV